MLKNCLGIQSQVSLAVTLRVFQHLIKQHFRLSLNIFWRYTRISAWFTWFLTKRAMLPWVPASPALFSARTSRARNWNKIKAPHAQNIPHWNVLSRSLDTVIVWIESCFKRIYLCMWILVGLQFTVVTGSIDFGGWAAYVTSVGLKNAFLYHLRCSQLNFSNFIGFRWCPFKFC